MRRSKGRLSEDESHVHATVTTTIPVGDCDTVWPLAMTFSSSTPETEQALAKLVNAVVDGLNRAGYKTTVEAVRVDRTEIVL